MPQLLMSIIWFLLIGIVAGWLGSLILKKEGQGMMSYFLIGVVGALLGGVLFRVLDLAFYRPIGDFVAATVGAVILLLILAAFKKIRTSS